MYDNWISQIFYQFWDRYNILYYIDYVQLFRLRLLLNMLKKLDSLYTEYTSILLELMVYNFNSFYNIQYETHLGFIYKAKIRQVYMPIVDEWLLVLCLA